MSEVVVMSTQCHLSATNSKIMYWKRFLEKRLKTFGDGKKSNLLDAISFSAFFYFELFLPCTKCNSCAPSSRVCFLL